MKRIVPLLIIAVIGVIVLVTLSTGQVPGTRPQTNNPEASTLYATSQQGLLFFVIAGGLISAVIGNAVLAALIMWILNWRIKRAKERTSSPFSFSLNPAKPNSLGAVMATHPMITVGFVVVLIAGLALVLVVTGAIR